MVMDERVGTRAAHVSRSFPAPGVALCGLAWDGTHLWHSDSGTDRIYECDPADGSLLRQLPCPEVRTCLSWDGRHLWQIAGRPKRLRRLEPADGSVVEERGPLGEDMCGLEIDGERYWLTDIRGRIEQRALSDDRLVRTFPAEPRVAGVTVPGRPTGLPFDGHRLWYADHAARRIVAVSPIGVEREVER